jgi:hypothetical protein
LLYKHQIFYLNVLLSSEVTASFCRVPFFLLILTPLLF